MARQQVNFRTPALTTQQLHDLQELWETNATETILLCIDRIWRQEFGAKQKSGQTPTQSKTKGSAS